MFTDIIYSGLLLIFIHTSSCVADDGPLVTLPYGTIQGHVLRTLNGNYYNAFQEIPYAAPPIDKLRFKPPTVPDKWYGILPTTRNTRICYQPPFPLAATQLLQSEHCLFLNVYAPVNATDALPVLVWMHGGAYSIGDGTIYTYGPQFFIDYNIVVVTINYRLGPLGFLSTEDDVIPGNVGLKDQTFALQWIKQNIRLFGGDPEKVTISGESAGAMCVGLHLASKLSQGLFRGAILQSGTTISPPTRQPFARSLAFQLGRSIDPNFTSENSTELLNLLQSVPAASIAYTGIMSPWQATSGFPAWAPVLEDENIEGAFLTSPMHEDVKNGNINQVPIIIGFNTEEQLTFASNSTIGSSGLEGMKYQGLIYDNDLKTLLDVAFNMTDEHKYIAGRDLRKIYTDGTFEGDVGALIRYTSDLAFTTPAIRQADLQSKYTDVYLYQFSYSGPLGRQVTLGDEPLQIEGIDPNAVGHAEELFYFWENSLIPDITIFPPQDRLVQTYLVKLWTNFVKYLNPTPRYDSSLQNIIWPKVSPNKLDYLNINLTLSVQTNPKKYENWKEIIDKYAIPPLIVY